MPGVEVESCSFCGSRPGNLRHLVRGPGASICVECVRLCGDVLHDRDPILSLEMKSADGEPALREAGASTLEHDLVVQPAAARVLAHLAAAIRSGASGGRTVLLVGPAGTGKTRALRALEEAFARRPTAFIDAGNGDVMPQLPKSFLETRNQGVLFLDGLERLSSRPQAFEAIGALLDRTSASAGHGRIEAVFAAATVEMAEGALAGPLEARVGDAAHLVQSDASDMLQRAAARGIPASLLARFEVFVPFEPLGAEELHTLLELQLDGIIGDTVAGGYRLRVGPEAREVVVARALRLGGGVWGLKAVLAAMLSGVLPELGEGLPPADAVRATPARR